MRRREFITLLGSAVATWPLAARSQQPTKLPTIGYLGATTPSVESQRIAALVQRLREFGWIESHNLTIEYRYAEGRSERYAELAAEFVRLNVDVIVTYGTPAVTATKQATAVIPIVFAVAGDPIGSGLVSSLPRPGGNLTGLSLQKTDVADKRLELLREVVPVLRGLAVMANAGNPVSVREMREVEATARRLGHKVAIFEIQRAEDIAPTFEALKGRWRHRGCLAALGACAAADNASGWRPFPSDVRSRRQSYECNTTGSQGCRLHRGRERDDRVSLG
jgi:putative ABC transport system substrate-binding protein